MFSAAVSRLVAATPAVWAGPGLLAIVLALSGPAWASSPERPPPADLDEEMARHERNLGAIEQRLSDLRKSLSRREHDRDALYRELEQNERDIGDLALAGRQLEKMTAEQRAVVNRLEARQTTARRDLEKVRKALSELLRSAYAMGRGDRLRMLLNQEDLTRSGRLLGYYRCIGRQRSRRIAEVQRLAAELASLRVQAQSEAERLEQVAARQEETRLRLEAAQAARSAILASLEETISESRGELALLDENAEALRELITTLRLKVQIAAEIDLSQEDIASRKGRLAWPLGDARLISSFQGGTDTGDLHADGVLIAAAEGQEVRAVHHGRVIYADWLRGFGLLLVIDHGDGYMTLYGHNQTLLKEVGEWVATDEAVALAGTSGGSSDRGLYFALRHHGAPLDPEQWCRAGSG
jgi:septal ring factor EnvC (AmiA/AmiB activator)